MPGCQLCGAPGGHPYCNEACRAAAPTGDDPIYVLTENPEPDWQPGDPCPF